MRAVQKIIPFLLFFFFTLILLFVLRTFWILSHTSTPDFSVYYQAAQNMREAASVYTGVQSFTLFAYPLVSALFFLPFTIFSYQTAQTVFLLCNFAALAAICWLAPLLLFRKQSLLTSAFIFSFSFLSFPTKFTLGMGQINLVAYACLLVSVLFFQKRKMFGVVLFFALACVLKPILGFLLLFFILQKQWKAILLAFTFFVLGGLLSLVVDHHALVDYLYYAQHVIPEISKPQGKEVYYNQGLMSFVFRETANQTLRVILSYIGMAILFLTGLLAAVKHAKQPLYQFSLLLSSLLLLDTMSWQHHFVLLIFPFAYCFLLLYRQKAWKRLFLLAVSYLLVSGNIAHPNQFLQFPMQILLSNTFYGALLLFILLVTLKQTGLAGAKGESG